MLNKNVYMCKMKGKNFFYRSMVMKVTMSKLIFATIFFYKTSLNLKFHYNLLQPFIAVNCVLHCVELMNRNRCLQNSPKRKNNVQKTPNVQRLCFQINGFSSTRYLSIRCTVDGIWWAKTT